MPIEKQDSNNATLYVGLQAVKGAPATEFYAQEPNTFSDFGGDVSTVTRAPIGTRKKQRGSITGLSAKGGWNTDLTPTNFARWAKGFFLNPISAAFSTRPVDAPLVGAPNIAITSVAAADRSFNAAAGLLPFIKRLLVKSNGFANAANNVVFEVAADAVAGKVTAVVGTALVNEAAPPATARLSIVGVRFAAGDIAATTDGVTFTLTSTVFDFTTLLALKVGAWYHIGGDLAASQFAGNNNVGFARLASITAHTLVFDKTSFVAIADVGAGQQIEVYFPTAIMQDGAAVTEYYYTVYRELGPDAVGAQSEVLYDVFASEFTINMPKKDKVTLDLSYMALDHQARSGTDGVIGATHVAALGESCFNTSSDLYRMKLSLLDPLHLNPTGYFAYASSGNLKVTNNIGVNEALGVASGFSYSIGDFEVNGSIDAYFTTVDAIEAIRANSLVTYDVIVTGSNAGWYFDIPQLELSGGMPKIEKNKSITLPLTTAGVQNANGYVAQFGLYRYLPNVAMAANA